MEEYLQSLGLDPDDYMKKVMQVAFKRKYNYKLLKFANDNIHKLEYNGIKFGRVKYKDKIIYQMMEDKGHYPEGTAKMKAKNYRKRAFEVMKNTRDKYSPASLSYYIIW